MDRSGGTELATFCCLTTLIKQLEYIDVIVDVYMYAKPYHNQRQEHGNFRRLFAAVRDPGSYVWRDYGIITPPSLYLTANGLIVGNGNGPGPGDGNVRIPPECFLAEKGLK